MVGVVASAAVLALAWLPSEVSLAADSARSASAHSQRKPTHPSPQQGNVSATLRPAVFGADDGLPRQLVAGRTYVAHLQVWVTPGAKNPRAHFSLADGSKPRCGHPRLRGGQVTRATCTFVVPASRGPKKPRVSTSTLTVAVTMAGSNETFTQSYPHPVIGSTR